MPNIATISGNMLTESVVDLATLPSGSGTTNYLPKWATSTSLGNSLVFDNGTNVGIGTTSPGNLGSNITTLSINGRDDAFTGGIWLRSSANSVRGYIYGTSSLFTIGSETSQPMTFQTAATERMRIAANGRVLINSTTDVGNYGLQVNGANLYVRGTANDNNTTVLQISNAAGSSLLQMRTDAHTYLGGLEFNRGGSGTIYGSSVDVVFTAYAALENLRCNFYAGVVVNEGGRGDVYFRVEGDTDANLLYTAPATDRIGIGTNAPAYKLDITGNLRSTTDAYFATSSGNVGIGTTSPTTKLDVVGRGRFGSQDETRAGIFVGNPGQIVLSNTYGGGYNVFLGAHYNYDPFVQFGFGSGTNPLTATASANFLEVGSENVSLGWSGNVNLNFRSSGATRFMLTRSTYNFLIGTTTDSGFKLDVNGTSRATSFYSDTYRTFSTAAGQTITFITGSNTRATLTDLSGGIFNVNGNITSTGQISPGTRILLAGGANIISNYQDAIIIRNGPNSSTLSTLVLDDADGTSASGYQIQRWKTGGVTKAMLDRDGNFVTLSSAYIGSISAINSSAIIQADSTTKGFLPPRMTAVQAEAIATPAEGLMVYATTGTGVTITSKGWWGYDGAAWVKLN